MSHVTFDNLWEDAMRELVRLVKLEVPTYSFQGPQNLVDYARIYVKYFQIYKMLEDCYDQLVHPQKRNDCKRTLEAVVGRVLEVKHWMVHLNGGKDVVNLEDTLVNMKLTPDSIDVVAPRFLTSDNAQNLETREKFLLKVIDKVETNDGVDSGYPVYTMEQAILLLQANERGRQARDRVTRQAKTRIVQEEALKKQQAGYEPLSQEAAAVIMQSAARGFIARCRVKHSAKDELNLIGMYMFARNTAMEKAFNRLKEIELERKKKQLMNLEEYQNAMVSAKQQVRELEGQEMREIVQERINKWLNDNRDPETGFYPPFPKQVDGGSLWIVHPPPKLGYTVEDKKKKKDEKDDKKKKKGKGGPIPLPVQLPEEDDDEEKPPSCPKFFLRHVRECLQIYTTTWHDKDNSSDLFQRHDYYLLKAQLRPLVFEEIRLEVDETTRGILEKIKQKILAELKAARKKGEKKDEKKKESKDKKDDGEEPPAPKKKPKKPKDPTAQRTIESIYSELAKSDIIQCCPKRKFAEYIATESFFGTSFDLDQSGLDPSMAQVKRLAIEYCVLPLVSELVHEHVPPIKAVLLYGGEENGKTLLVHAACRETGATYINLSPHVTDGKYPGKQAAKMLQMVFKIAKVMAPSIIHVKDVDKIFVTDKKKIKAWGFKDKPNRLKKPLIKEVNAIRPGERVLLIGTASRPHEAPAKAPSLLSVFTKRIYVPFPDYGARSALWKGLMERHGGGITEEFNLPTISQLSDGYSIGCIHRLCKTVLTDKRKRKVRMNPLKIEEFMDLLYDSPPVEPDLHQALREWGKPKESNSNSVAEKDSKKKK